MVCQPVPVMGATSPPNYYPHQLPRPVVTSQPVMGGPVTSYQQPQPQQLPQPQMVSGSGQMPVQAMPVQAQRQMPNPAQMPMPGHPPMPMQSRPLVPMPAPPTEAGAPPAGAEGKKLKAVYDGSTKPRRAQTALNFFSAFARKAVRKENPEISEDDLKSAVQQSWNMLAAPERLKFEEKEAADLVRFQQQTKVFEELNPSAAGAAGASSAGAGSAGEWSRVVISLKGTPEKLDSLDGPRTPAGKAKAKAKGSDSKGGNGSGSKGSGKLGAKSKSPLAKAKGTGKDGGKAATKGSKDGDGKPGKDGKEGEKKRVRGPPANAHALKKPRTAYQVFCSEQKPVVMAQTKRAFAAKPPSDKPDGAPAADKPSSGAAPGPSGDGDAASSEAKKIALAVGVALSRAWKNLGIEGRGAYEERAEQEKALVIRDVQAAHPQWLAIYTSAFRSPTGAETLHAYAHARVHVTCTSMGQCRRQRSARGRARAASPSCARPSRPSRGNSPSSSCSCTSGSWRTSRASWCG